MKIILEIQVIYHDFKVIIKDFSFYRKYFEELILKIEKIINNHDMKFILKNFIIFIYNKSIKKKIISKIKSINQRIEMILNFLLII